VVAAGDAQLAAWQAIGDDPPYAELTVLTACRVWRFAEEGRHVSKAAAGERALGRDPTLGVVGDALRRRHGDPAARIDPAQVARLLAVVRGACQGTRPRLAEASPLVTLTRVLVMAAVSEARNTAVAAI